MGQMTFGPKKDLFKGITKEHVEKVLRSEEVRIKEVPVEIIKYVETIKEVPTFIEKIVEKEIIKYVEVPIEKIVDRIVEVEKHVVTEIEVIKEIPTYMDRIVVKVEDKIPGIVFAIIGIETLAIIVLLAKLI